MKDKGIQEGCLQPPSIRARTKGFDFVAFTTCLRCRLLMDLISHQSLPDLDLYV